MFHPNRTAFLIGAGASCHYGYPTGEQLVRLVRERADEAAAYFSDLSISDRVGIWQMPDIVTDDADPRWRNDSRLRAAAAERMLSLCKRLSLKLKVVDPLVIDYFLGQNREMEKLGKLLIAWIILDAEALAHKRASEKTNGAGNWHRFLVQKLVSNCPIPKSLLDNRVTFITFNYDVSLEWSLYQALSSIEYFSESSIVSKFFEETPFIHVYGKIRNDATGAPAHIAESIVRQQGADQREYFDNVLELMNVAYAASKGIRIIAPDEKVISPHVAQARRALAEADRVYILGYGFDEENSKLLDLRTQLRHDDPLPPARRRKEVLFTNFNDFNTVNKRASRVFFGNPRNFLPGGQLTHEFNGSTYEKSIRNVYDAFAYDFDSPEGAGL